ncbi:MAG: hypothetical protein H0T78_06220 [Longispora sp.]|nr:hypothetical protein [Longispora sp. (in: high G+C Gram-positive bacteria)]
MAVFVPWYSEIVTPDFPGGIPEVKVLRQVRKLITVTDRNGVLKSLRLRGSDVSQWPGRR